MAAQTSIFSCNRASVTGVRIFVVFLALLGLSTWLYGAPYYQRASQYAAPKDIPAADTNAEADKSIEQSKDDIASTFFDTCASAPGADKIMVMLKTGATEVYQKLPTHFVTTFECVPRKNLMIFSDLAQNFADYTIHDAIAPISKHFREQHDDFELYRKLEKYQREGQDMSKLKGDGGWNLDKWKFLPMMFEAFEAAGPEIEWFFIMEADTSVSWTNMLQWLKTMNPRQPYYLGAQNVIGDTTFAHGGSGVVISRKAADLLRKKRQDYGKVKYNEKWEELTSTSCCGDEVIARAFEEVDVKLTPAWPLIQGETVSSIDWTEKHWCTPAITWHHVTPIEVDAMFQFQAEWVDDHGWDVPFLYRDVFEHFISRHVTVNRTSWNNLSKDQKFVSASLAQGDDKNFYELEDYEKKSIESAEACAAACKKKPDYECVQWMYMKGRCHIGKDLRFGRSDETSEEHWTSGWDQERLDAFRKKFKDCKIKWEG